MGVNSFSHLDWFLRMRLSPSNVCLYVLPNLYVHLYVLPDSYVRLYILQNLYVPMFVKRKKNMV